MESRRGGVRGREGERKQHQDTAKATRTNATRTNATRGTQHAARSTHSAQLTAHTAPSLSALAYLMLKHFCLIPKLVPLLDGSVRATQCSVVSLPSAASKSTGSIRVAHPPMAKTWGWNEVKKRTRSCKNTNSARRWLEAGHCQCNGVVSS